MASPPCHPAGIPLTKRLIKGLLLLPRALPSTSDYTRHRRRRRLCFLRRWQAGSVSFTTACPRSIAHPDAIVHLMHSYGTSHSAANISLTRRTVTATLRPPAMVIVTVARSLYRRTRVSSQQSATSILCHRGLCSDNEIAGGSFETYSQLDNDSAVPNGDWTAYAKRCPAPNRCLPPPGPPQPPGPAPPVPGKPCVWRKPGDCVPEACVNCKFKGTTFTLIAPLDV